MVAKLAHANPMTVLRTIVHQVLYYRGRKFNCLTALKFFTSEKIIFSWIFYLQIEAYRDMITPVVDAFKYLTQVLNFFCNIPKEFPSSSCS